jgi:SAM-dependent methyltransferase
VTDSGEAGPDVLLEAGYLDLTYSAERAPVGEYPLLLARLLLDRHFKTPGRILDFGCGRGDALQAFAALGFEAVGADVSPRAAELASGFEVAVVDPATSQLPFQSNSFDAVFSKSVVEHMPTPMDLAREAHRVLKPGAKFVVMTPSWQHQAWGPFYIDHTHVTPFTAPSLKDLLVLAGFESTTSEHFLQLPFTWGRAYLRPLPWLVSKLPLPYRPYRERAPWPEGLNKLIRFSKEMMLLASGTKAAS